MDSPRFKLLSIKKVWYLVGAGLAYFALTCDLPGDAQRPPVMISLV